MAEETTYLDDATAGVKVTSARAVLGDKTFAMSNITSVSMSEIPAKSGGLLFIVVIGLVILLCGFTQQDEARWVAVGLGAVLVVIGLVLSNRVKPTYAVRIGSASGESNALEAEDKARIQKIVDAMNEAIVKRG